MQRQTFSTSQTSLLTGLSIRQLNHWAQHKLFIPSGRTACGQGTRNLYTSFDIVQLLSLKKLKCYHWSTQKIQKAVTMLRSVMQDENPLKQSFLVADGKSMLAVCKTKAGERILLDAFAEGGQQVMIIVLEIMEEETRQAIERLLRCEEHSQEYEND